MGVEKDFLSMTSKVRIHKIKKITLNEVNSQSGNKPTIIHKSSID